MNRLRNSPYKKRLIISTLLMWFLYVTSSLCFANCNINTADNSSDTTTVNSHQVVRDTQAQPNSPHDKQQTVNVKLDHCGKIIDEQKRVNGSTPPHHDESKSNCCTDDCNNQGQIAIDGKSGSFSSLLFTTISTGFTETLYQPISNLLTNYFRTARQKIPIPDIFLLVCSFLN